MHDPEDLREPKKRSGEYGILGVLVVALLGPTYVLTQPWRQESSDRGQWREFSMVNAEYDCCYSTKVQACDEHLKNLAGVWARRHAPPSGIETIIGKSEPSDPATSTLDRTMMRCVPALRYAFGARSEEPLSAVFQRELEGPQALFVARAIEANLSGAGFRTDDANALLEAVTHALGASHDHVLQAVLIQTLAEADVAAENLERMCRQTTCTDPAVARARTFGGQTEVILEKAGAALRTWTPTEIQNCVQSASCAHRMGLVFALGTGGLGDPRWVAGLIQQGQLVVSGLRTLVRRGRQSSPWRSTLEELTRSSGPDVSIRAASALVELDPANGCRRLVELLVKRPLETERELVYRASACGEVRSELQTLASSGALAPEFVARVLNAMDTSR